MLFVCRANVCRSPMAEWMFNALAGEVGEGFQAQSAGVAAREGFDMAPRTRDVLHELGYPAGEHRSRSVSGEAFREADVVLTMSRRQSAALAERFGEERKVSTLAEFAGDFAEPDIADPYGMTIFHYRTAARRIDRCVRRVLERLSEGDYPRGD
ncbi:hypothetical protein [Rubrobacter radiotolerans]|uniref:Phosphotyrosine protein phosphatase I domain-containing protein n=1 Tax=Rubrobacter radiotolerans TaxID=42256 RepID=A0AB35T9B2_RUBRA|nr:hypothetical protein [Rubrobacter radiotolerans]MDX5894406.1 hypothetical protein [Rubrobacter radiotolerans]